jgi:hypothetical protein
LIFYLGFVCWEKQNVVECGACFLQRPLTGRILPKVAFDFIKTIYRQKEPNLLALHDEGNHRFFALPSRYKSRAAEIFDQLLNLNFAPLNRNGYVTRMPHFVHKNKI